MFVCLVQLTTAGLIFHGHYKALWPLSATARIVNISLYLFYQISPPLQPLQKANSWHPSHPAYSASPYKTRQQWTQNIMVTGRLSETWARKLKSCPKTMRWICLHAPILKSSITIPKWDLNMLVLTTGGTFLQGFDFCGMNKSLQFIKSL